MDLIWFLREQKRSKRNPHIKSLIDSDSIQSIWADGIIWSDSGQSRSWRHHSRSQDIVNIRHMEILLLNQWLLTTQTIVIIVIMRNIMRSFLLLIFLQLSEGEMWAKKLKQSVTSFLFCKISEALILKSDPWDDFSNYLWFQEWGKFPIMKTDILVLE